MNTDINIRFFRFDSWDITSKEEIITSKECKTDSYSDWFAAVAKILEVQFCKCKKTVEVKNDSVGTSKPIANLAQKPAIASNFFGIKHVIENISIHALKFNLLLFERCSSLELAD